jgi:hypothetical protein
MAFYIHSNLCSGFLPRRTKVLTVKKQGSYLEEPSPRLLPDLPLLVADLAQPNQFHGATGPYRSCNDVENVK